MGLTLGYYVKSEYKMKEEGFGSQAIDVAWFNDNSNEFPLMIFEIESTTNNSIINNPANVFGKDSKTFEKPLFFFHIIMNSSKESEKYSDMYGLFGKYNYDIFRINNGDMNNLIIKIISQHRRINSSVRLENMLHMLLSESEILESLNLRDLLVVLELLIHEQESYHIGQVYANMSLIHKEFIKEYIAFLKRFIVNERLSNLSYESYEVSIVSDAINIGLLCYDEECAMGCLKLSEMLYQFQNKYDHFKTIDYLPGLNYDYDIFIQDYVSFYLAVIFLLVERCLDARKFILSIATDILKKINKDDDYVTAHHVSWVLIMSASSEAFIDEFEEVKSIVNSNGGINELILYGPSTTNDYHNCLVYSESEKVFVPSVDEYKSRLKESFKEISNNFDLLDISFRCISSIFLEEDSDSIINLGLNLASLYIEKLGILNSN